MSTNRMFHLTFATTLPCLATHVLLPCLCLNQRYAIHIEEDLGCPIALFGSYILKGLVF